MTDADIELNGRLIKILMSLPRFQINFWLNNIRVAPIEFTDLFNRLLYQDINISINPKKLEKAHANAIYSKPDNTFYFRAYDFGTWPHERAVMFHECVHASQDLQKANNYALQEEAAAYVAQLMYMRYATGLTTAEYLKNFGSSLNDLEPHEKIANSISDKMIGRKPGDSVDYNDYVDLIKSLQAHPSYSAIREKDDAPNDG